MRVLIDVANGRVGEELVELLRRAGHVVERGAAAVSAKRFDVVVVASAEAAAKLAPHRAVIVFTRTGDVAARIAALEAGAADAVDGSFAMSQVAARIGAAGRRAASVPRDPQRIELADGVIDLDACTCERAGHVETLTAREVAVIRWLARRAGQVVSRAELLEHVWGVSARNETRAVDVAIAELRKKLGPASITTVKGAGYCLHCAYKPGSSL